MSRVDGDVTVQHLTEVEQQGSTILRIEYGSAQEQFRKISRLKKAVDSRTGAHPHAMAAAVAAHSQAAPPSHPGHAAGAGDAMPGGLNLEQGKLRAMEDTVRSFILAANPASANVVPLRNGNIALSNVEVDAFRNDYGGEKSYRADYAHALRQAVSIQARLQSELEEYNSKQSSAYLWKPHADALTFLISTAQNLQAQCGAILATAEQRGLTDKVAAMNSSLQKMRHQVQLAVKALQGNGSSS
jgi:hypothetical protein